MDTLWAPWRMEFILGDKDGDCVFCSRSRDEERVRENLILERGKHSFVILNKYPYNSGHLMVVPFRHTAELGDLNPDEALEIHGYLQQSIAALREELAPDGFNIGLNLGRAAGAGIESHLHYHVVPRWNGDTNFMPIIASTKSMPEHLLVTYDRLQPRFA